MEALRFEQEYIVAAKCWQMTLYRGNQILDSILIADDTPFAIVQDVLSKVVDPWRHNPDDEDDV